MTGRTADDFAHERAAIDAAHATNETGRDSFVSLAHTALFASSVAFVGDVAPLRNAVWRPALIMGWTASVVGLLALTLSFGAARRLNDARRVALNDDVVPTSPLLDVLNAVSLWSFPVSLLCLFSFVTANVISADEPSSKPPVSTRPAVASTVACSGSAPAIEPVRSVDGDAGQLVAAPGAQPHRSGRGHTRRRHDGTPSPDADASATAPAATTQEMRRYARREGPCS